MLLQCVTVIYLEDFRVLYLFVVFCNVGHLLKISCLDLNPCFIFTDV